METIDNIYLKNIRDRSITTITISLAKFVQFLFQWYGVVKVDDLCETKDEIKQFVYDISDPIAEFYNPIEDLEKSGVAVNDFYTS